jgi:Putative metal-binding domain of cation transport ATPase
MPPQLNWLISNALITTGIIPNLNMYPKLLRAIQALFVTDHISATKISCYHCGEKSTPSRTVYVQFEGGKRAVCCNGCAAILKTIEELGMNEEYHAHKIQHPIENE